MINPLAGWHNLLGRPAVLSMVEAVGFRMTSDIVALLCIFFALCYFIFAEGPSAFRDTCRKKRLPNINDSIPDDAKVNDNDYFNMKEI